MVKILKYTPVFMLWLAGMIICVHMIIPHDHHSAAVFSDLDNKCPFSHESTDHHSKFPTHCYAFNDLISEKSIPIKVLPVIQHDLIPLLNNSAFSSHEILITSVCTDTFNNSLCDPFASGFLLLRAPPFIL